MVPLPKTRFAPSPTGLLHLGHAYSALLCWAADPQMVLRLEDIDQQRSKPEYAEQILEDLSWLGVTWSGMERQTKNRARHLAALESLREEGLLYPCFCTRREIQVEAARIGGAPHGIEGPAYPGTCRDLPLAEQEKRMRSEDHCWRLNVRQTLHALPNFLAPDLPQDDVILARKDSGLSYHLCSVVDDAASGFDLVVRGEDLLPFKPLHQLLLAALGLPQPEYLHHPLIGDREGRRLAKRSDAESIKALRSQGLTVKSLWSMALDRKLVTGQADSGIEALEAVVAQRLA